VDLDRILVNLKCRSLLMKCILLGKGHLETLAGNLNGKVLGHYGEEGDYITGDKGLVVV